MSIHVPRALLLVAALAVAACADLAPPVIIAPAVATAAPAATPMAAPSASSIATAGSPSEADEQRLVAPHLGGKKLAHPALRGAFGPWRDAIVALTATADGPPAALDGFVIVDGGRVLPLPSLHDQWSLWEVDAVMFEDVDGDGAKELIVIAEYLTGVGPTGAQPFNANAVVRWNGSAFVRMPEVEQRIERLPDAASIRKALRARGGGSRH